MSDKKSLSGDVRIVPATLELVEGYRQCVDAVARERTWLAIVEAFPIEETRRFLTKNLREQNPAFFAVETPLDDYHSPIVQTSRVVGWADTRRPEGPGSQHRLELGMGVLTNYRRRGIGQRLLRALIEAVKATGAVRLELSVYAENVAGHQLYRKLGFVEEGRLIKGRFIDGRFDDVIRMAMIFEENVLPKP